MNAHAVYQSPRRDEQVSYPFTLPITPIDWTWDHRASTREGCRDDATSRAHGGRQTASQKPLAH
jgi:hypothetical protein